MARGLAEAPDAEAAVGEEVEQGAGVHRGRLPEHLGATARPRRVGDPLGTEETAPWGRSERLVSGKSVEEMNSKKSDPTKLTHKHTVLCQKKT